MRINPDALMFALWHSHLSVLRHMMQTCCECMPSMLASSMLPDTQILEDLFDR